jgi:two-component sensor histidine kinase
MRANAERSGRLKLVGVSPRDAVTESVSERVRKLQNEARALALGQVAEMQDRMRTLAALADEIADGGDAYPVGARELARRMSEELAAKAQTLQAIVSKS